MQTVCSIHTLPRIILPSLLSTGWCFKSKILEYHHMEAFFYFFRWYCYTNFFYQSGPVVRGTCAFIYHTLCQAGDQQANLFTLFIKYNSISLYKHYNKHVWICLNMNHLEFSESKKAPLGIKVVRSISVHFGDGIISVVEIQQCTTHILLLEKL